MGRFGSGTGKAMTVRVLAVLTLGACIGPHPAHAQRATDAPDRPATATLQSAPGFARLQGRWIRPDGGYVITIRSVDERGRIDAGYANPNPLPFSRAEASREGDTLKVFLELRAGGYNGSTYTLTYDPVKDILEGVYFQAVARQIYDVRFVRGK
jgi:hypothetical protein